MVDQLNVVSTTTNDNIDAAAARYHARAKCWTVTIFDFGNFTIELLENIGNGLKYGIIGRETCAATRRIHYQCYFYFNSAVRFATLKARLPRGTHLQQARGTPYQNFLYCSKEYIVREIGERPVRMERRRRMEEQSSLLKKFYSNEITLEEFVERDNVFVMRNFNKIMSLKAMLIPDRTEQTELYLIIGEPGVGKTTFACSLSKNYFMKTQNTEKWWDGYEQQEVVILDQFYGWLSPPELFHLADSKRHLVQIKGGFTKFNSKALVITSNKLPEFWWEEDVVAKYDMAAFNRRVTLTWIWNKTNESMRFNYDFNMDLVRSIFH